MQNSLDQIDALFGELNQMQPLTPENKQKLDKKFRMEFNYNSNHMEGNTLTYSETELLLIFDDTKGSHTMREYDEMRAHDAAYRLIEEWAADNERPLTEQNIKNLNEIILVKPFWKEAITPDGQATRRLIKIGDYKEHPNSVRLQNGEIFEYASPTDTPILMQELIDWYRTEEGKLHPCTLATMLHYKFVRIHPFDDGNGRVSRLLMNYVLLRNGFPPIVIKSNDKANYLRALHQADLGDYEALVRYICDQQIWSLQISLKAAKGESIDEPGDLDKKIMELNKKLKIANGSKVRIKKDKKSLISVLDNVFWPLVNSVEDKLSELEIHFRSKEIKILINGAEHEYRPGITKLQQLISEQPSNINMVGIQIKFISFRSAGEKRFNASISLSISFHSNVYEIQSSAIAKIYGKLYDEALVEHEKTQIIEATGTKIVEDIEKFIDSN